MPRWNITISKIDWGSITSKENRASATAAYVRWRHATRKPSSDIPRMEATLPHTNNRTPFSLSCHVLVDEVQVGELELVRYGQLNFLQYDPTKKTYFTNRLLKQFILKMVLLMAPEWLSPWSNGTAPGWLVQSPATVAHVNQRGRRREPAWLAPPLQSCFSPWSCDLFIFILNSNEWNMWPIEFLCEHIRLT